MQNKVHPHTGTPVVEVDHKSYQIERHTTLLQVYVPLLFDALASWTRQLVLEPVPAVEVFFK